MVDIIHRVGVRASASSVYTALSTTDGIAGWWTKETTGDTRIGGTLNVRFLAESGQEIGSMNMEIVELIPDKTVHWRFTSGPDEWIDTDVVFDLAEDGDYTIVLFSHKNWREAIEFTAHCSMKWATFMLSLKDLVETGIGKPSPTDIKIDNWN
ncbi:SRPBCC family protein [Aureliella helgolandensis]|uniref:Activator of Hsp90 ATPase homologue 1/2-like C-terminal domain-containing protein n=1 Tax=Aureliella helgolandensis TaxID=2527968 RepID=A0A518G495_9BACT|nr:SRPBCC domain-containing protein [Aureliella helgolandensis]QDV23411.1 hypothetical protein Q31a_17090 [Aureliella helgolandensis]